MQLKVWKYQGAGNDFIAIDSRKKSKSVQGSEFFSLTAFEMEKMVQKLCDRRRGVGADGVLVLHEDRTSDFRMKYYNADGSLGDMCGNGARCIVRFAEHLDIIQKKCRFNTDAGEYNATIEENGQVTLDFPDIADLPKRIEILIANNQRKDDEPEKMVYPGSFQCVGVNHAVFFVEKLGELDVERFGPEIRHHVGFEPEGTNVNFAELEEKRTIRLRTYERGVEAETLACGTGSVATAISRAVTEDLQGRNKWKIIPTGGEALTVQFTLREKSVTDVKLGGPAILVCEIKIKVDLLS